MVQPRADRRTIATRRLTLNSCRRGDSPVLGTDVNLVWNKGRTGPDVLGAFDSPVLKADGAGL